VNGQDEVIEREDRDDEGLAAIEPYRREARLSPSGRLSREAVARHLAPDRAVVFRVVPME